MIQIKPIYSETNTKIIHNLFYDWTGWLTENAELTSLIVKTLNTCEEKWRNDGMQLIENKYSDKNIQLLFKVSPNISPFFFTQKIKGRLTYMCRINNIPIKFSRKVSFRCLGNNTTKIVKNYIKSQVNKSDYFDIRFKDFLSNYTVLNNSVNLSFPVIVAHGRYWYNVHLVIVVDNRKFPINKVNMFEIIKKYCFKIAKKKKCAIAQLAIMPDHIHISIKGNPELSPKDIGFAFINNLSFALGFNKCWKNEFYIGSFSEYNLKAI